MGRARKWIQRALGHTDFTGAPFTMAAFDSTPGPSLGSGLLLESPADSFLILETSDYLLLE